MEYTDCRTKKGPRYKLGDVVYGPERMIAEIITIVLSLNKEIMYELKYYDEQYSENMICILSEEDIVTLNWEPDLNQKKGTPSEVPNSLEDWCGWLNK